MLCSVFARPVLHKVILGHKGEGDSFTLGGLLSTFIAPSHLHTSSDQGTIVLLKNKYLKARAF